MTTLLLQRPIVQELESNEDLGALIQGDSVKLKYFEFGATSAKPTTAFFYDQVDGRMEFIEFYPGNDKIIRGYIARASEIRVESGCICLDEDSAHITNYHFGRDNHAEFSFRNRVLTRFGGTS